MPYLHTSLRSDMLLPLFYMKFPPKRDKMRPKKDVKEGELSHLAITMRTVSPQGN